ncbi:MAG: methylmalonyl-CoA mutase, partial [Aurantimonas coralicida]
MTALTIEAIEFPEVDEAGWRARVEKGLKGRSFESLVTTAEDGFGYGPLYGRRTAAPLGRATSGPWQIVQ